MSMSYEVDDGDGSTRWVHECTLPVGTNIEDFEYSPFTRYKCKFNKYLKQDGSCESITHECSSTMRDPGNKFSGYHYKYTPECLIEKNDPSDSKANTSQCCGTCRSQVSESSNGNLSLDILTSSDQEKIFNSSDPNGNGYNTRPSSSWGGSSVDSQTKKDLFICQKTNFDSQVGQNYNLNSNGTSDIGRYPNTTPQRPATIDTICSDPNSDACQQQYNIFDPDPRNLTDEDYLWMKQGTHYDWENNTLRDKANTTSRNSCDTSNPIHMNIPDEANSFDDVWDSFKPLLRERIGKDVDVSVGNAVSCNLEDIDNDNCNSTSTIASSYKSARGGNPVQKRCEIKAGWARQNSVGAQDAASAIGAASVYFSPTVVNALIQPRAMVYDE